MTRGTATAIHAYVKPVLKASIFPLIVACLYGLAFLFSPEKTEAALLISGSIFRQLALPICLVLFIMVALNRFLSPVVITRLLGRSLGVKGVLLSSLAGILSMGPIYAWFPLLQSIREKGASPFHLANFIGCRSVKPILLPVLAVYFGWQYTACFVGVSLVGALTVAVVVSAFSGTHNR
ncbi:hypothetical protein [Pseudodesulfovibrio sediminis]|uniref:Permease n=1 Tax=Pseudodesulfovibrio sediminis TaxID=2810563 RepID=A0ABN6EQS4_9BACT|nr:hypothetical protein [Pseudodesulfovibrio sediminis]BCS87780.1 hypothetical protein PSDVSF_10220 [Pseudodesulfovibrio sediminis]